MTNLKIKVTPPSNFESPMRFHPKLNNKLKTLRYAKACGNKTFTKIIFHGRSTKLSLFDSTQLHFSGTFHWTKVTSARSDNYPLLKGEFLKIDISNS